MRCTCPGQKQLIALAAAALLTGCAVGPDYTRPTLDIAAAYKEAPGWKTASPQVIDSTHPWWLSYQDDTLSALMVQANAANQDIRRAEAQYRQAQAIADAARAGFWPTVGVNGSTGRALTNANGAIRLGNSDAVGLGVSWIPDVWGAVRRSVEAGDAGTQASADDLAGAHLSIQASLAQDYLQLRVIDLQRDLYKSTVAAYAKSFELTQHQFAAGVVLRSDVALAQSQLKTAQAQGLDLDAQRSQLEHAIAVLTGQAPAALSLAPEPIAGAPSEQAIRATLPLVPAGLPSELLERRPDIAGAERRVQAANANIGVAKAAFFPQIALSASGGFNAASMATLFNAPSRVWSLGAALALALFDGGLRQAHSDQAQAAYDATVAQYKQTVLAAFQQVEDNLATLRVLDEELTAQKQAVEAAQVAERLALAQYRGGTATYLSVVTAQTLLLSNQRTAAQLLGRQYAASVALYAATGGGWHAAEPTPEK